MKNLLNSIKILGILLIVGLGVSYVAAYTPGGAFPAGQVPAVINTSAANQTKVGGLLSDKYMVADLGFFTKTLLPGSDSWMNIGGTEPLTSSGISNDGSTIPLTFDLVGRSKTIKAGTQGQDAINFISGQAQCSTATAFINDRATAFEFTSGGTDTGHADLIARQLQLSGGTPQDNSVLAAVDNQGNAVWAKLVVENGVLKVIDNKTGLPIPSTGVTSPVVTDADCTPPPLQPAVTYAWSPVVWGACIPYNSGDWVDYTPVQPSGTTWGSLGQSCSSWINQTNTLYSGGIQTGTTVCKDSNGNTVADSLCTTPKPDTTKTCNAPLQYRVSVADTNPDPLNNVTTTYFSTPGSCLYAKLNNPNDNNPFGANFLYNQDCKSVRLTDPVPAGYSPVSYCGTLTVGGTWNPGFGFTAGPGGNYGGLLGTGGVSMKLQVKPQ